MKKKIEQINDIIKAKMPPINSQMFGMAESVVLRKEDADVVFPAVVEADGECVHDLLNDAYDCGLYHRLLDKTYAQESAGGFGNHPQLDETNNMCLIAYGKRAAIHAGELEKMAVDAIMACGGVVESSTFDRLSVFATEFQGIQFFLRPEIFLFRINYSIRKTSKC